MFKIISILFFLILISTTQAQSVVEIGMSKNEILKFNTDTCFSDTLDFGTPFIKALTNDKQNYIYYFFEKDICFSIILYFESYETIFKFKEGLDENYVKKSKNLWISSDKKYFIYYEDIEGEVPIFYIWSTKTKIPDSWDFLKDFLN